MGELSNVIDSKNTSTDFSSAVFALKAAGAGSWDLQFTGNLFIYLDDQCRKLLGIDHQTISFDEALSFIYSDDQGSVKFAIDHALLPSAGGNYDVRFRTRLLFNHRPRWIRSIGKCYFNQGEPYRFSGISLDVTQEMQGKEQSIIAENLAQVVVKGNHVGLFHYTLADESFEYSPAFAKILTGTRNLQMTHAAFLEHIHPEDRDIRSKAFSTSMESGDLFYEVRTIWNDGSVHWIRSVASVDFDNMGKPVSYSGTIQDITEIRQNQQELKEAGDRFSFAMQNSEAMFRNVTSYSPTGLWMSDPQGAITYLNNTLIEWTGISYEELLGNGWSGAIVEEDRMHSVDAFRYAVDHQTHYDVEFRMRKGNGDVIWCRAAADPYYNPDGSYAGFVGFCMDINDTVVTAKHLKVSEAKLRAIIEQAPLAIGLLTGKEMLIETANEQILKLWGKEKKVIGMRLSDAIPELQGQPFLQLLEKVYEDGEPYFGYSTEAWLEKKGKLQLLYFDFVYTPVRDANGNITGVMVLATEVSAQVLARKAIEESESRFRTLIEEAPFATALYSGTDLTIEMANDEMIKLWGKSADVIGMPLHLALPELDGQPFLDLLHEVYRTGIPYQTRDAKADLVIDGTLQSFYFNYTYKPLKNDKGEVYAILNMADDVTEQLLARKKIEESDLFTRSIIENSPVAKLVLMGEQLIIRMVNDNMLELLNRDESIKGLSFLDVMGDSLNSSFKKHLDEVLVKGATKFFPEERVEVSKNGITQVRYFNFIYKALPGADDVIYGVTITATEITEQVLARQKITEAEEALRVAIELAQLGTWTIDLGNKKVHYSPRLLTWFGFEQDQDISMEAAVQRLALKDRAFVERSIENAIDPSMNSTLDIEFTVIDKVTGTARVIHAQGNTFFNESGIAYKLSGTAQDVTKQRKIQLALEQEVRERTLQLQEVNAALTKSNEELNEANEQLVNSNEELAQYAYVASHDLQEPLRKIRMFSGMLSNLPSLSEHGKTLVDKISHSSSRMSLLIKDLLEFSKLLKTDYLKRPVDLSNILAAVTTDFELTVIEKGAVINSDTLPVIQAVSLQMNQLFYNLMSNALKFVSPGVTPQIQVRCEPIELTEASKYIHKPFAFSTYYKISFQDNGIGFEVKYSEQIFEVFKRLHGKELYPGSGIGLALCRRIVANHHGHLYAESSPGKGTTFYIILPDKQENVQSSLPEDFQWQ